MFKRWYVVRYSTASLSVRPTYMLIKAYSRKNAYKRIRKTLPRRYLVTDIYRCPRWLTRDNSLNRYEPDKRYDI